MLKASRPSVVLVVNNDIRLLGLAYVLYRQFKLGHNDSDHLVINSFNAPKYGNYFSS